MLYTIIGGIGTLLGPILGTGVVVYSEHNLVEFIRDSLGLPGELWLVGLGVMYIFIVLFMPRGIVGSIGRKSGAFKERLRQMKVGQIEFGIKDMDYWVFGLLGTIGLFLFLLQDSRFFLIAFGIFGFLGAVGFFLLFTFRKEISSRIIGSLKKRFRRGGN
jgi:hypothetical protein